MRTIDLVSDGGLVPPKKRGSEHPAAQLASKARSFLLSNGFDELLLPQLVDEKDIRMQLGSEAALALNRSYYVAGQPAPTIEGTDLSRLRSIAPSFNDAKAKSLHKIVESFSRGEIGTQELLDKMVGRLGIRMEQVTRILDVVVPGLRNLCPEPSPRVVRDSLVPSWFESLSAIIRRRPLPSFLFSIGPALSRESSSLYTSFVMVGDDASLPSGESVLYSFLDNIGIKSTLKKKRATSHHFIPGTETIVLAKDGSSLGRIGMLSPLALSNYDIDVPVFCASVSLSAIAVALGKASTERAALYPQFYGNWILPDSTIAALVQVGESPVTPWGRDLSRKIVRTAELYSGHRAPCEFKVFDKELDDHRVEVWLTAKSKTLCDDSVLDELVVHDGVILNVPPTGRGSDPKVRAARNSGVRTGIRLLNSFADLVASRVERNPFESQSFIMESVSSPEDANISIPNIVSDYVESKEKGPSVNASLGLSAEARVRRLWVHEQPR
jgi:O-phosphoseryl-tRNA synthetase